MGEESGKDFITGLEKQIVETQDVWSGLKAWGCKSVEDVNILWGTTPMRIVEGSPYIVSFDMYTNEIKEVSRSL